MNFKCSSVIALNHHLFFSINCPITLTHLSDVGTLHNNEEVEVAVRECLRIQELDLHCDGIFKLVPIRTDVSVCSGVVWNTYCGAAAELPLVLFSSVINGAFPAYRALYTGMRVQHSDSIRNGLQSKAHSSQSNTLIVVQ